jgi:hypothetical protein
VTKVLRVFRGLGIAVLAGTSVCAPARAAVDAPTEKPAEALYLQLGEAGLDPARVYRVRDASLDRSAVHIELEDGTIAFTQDVMGRITGAFFEGDGEILLTPPNDVERRSMSLFTGMAILEEHFATAYFRFNDDAARDLQSGLRAPENPQEFLTRWGGTARNLAPYDAMRLLISFSRMLPAGGAASSAGGDSPGPVSAGDRFLHARLQGTKLGVFDVYFDSASAEPVQAGQARTTEGGVTYYDSWTSFSPIAPEVKTASERPAENSVGVRRFAITTKVLPPRQIHAQARLQLDVRQGGERTLLFELSRFLEVESVKLNGRPVEFIHNPAVEGTQLSRRGNDVVAVILPEPARAGQKMELEFVYAGEVLAEAGSGLLYVGARGNWYPNRGLAMADFDLEFNYPQGWTLVATGKPAPVISGKGAGIETSHWISERPIPVAGFNLGKYKMVRTQAGSVTVETYAATAVERDFPSPGVQVIEPHSSDLTPQVPKVILPSRPSPTQNEVNVGEAAARAIRYYAERFGPYPYSSLALTQLPGRDSQGWPGLIFLSSYVFLNEQDRQQLHFEPYQILLQESVPAHETAHQWWGDLVGWSGYRDQWLSEGLANYCALMMLQEKNPEGFRQVMENYRQILVKKNKDDRVPKDAGPVTLGVRLLSSRFPEGYEAISYGRGAWLFHMLRTMLKDAAAQPGASRPGAARSGAGRGDEPFVRALRKVRQKYEGKFISTRELLDAFAEDLPPSLRYEGKNSLDWFLEGWINGTSLPKLELKGVKLAAKGAGLEVSATILQKDAPPDLVTSVPVYAVITGRQPVLLGRVFADGEESSFRIAAPPGTHKVLLDPENTILTSPK